MAMVSVCWLALAKFIIKIYFNDRKHNVVKIVNF